MVVSQIMCNFAAYKQYKEANMNTSYPTTSQQIVEVSPVDALWTLIQSQTKSVRKALAKRILAEEEKTKAQKKMVKESLSRAFDELQAGNIHPDAHNLFVE